VQLSYQEDYFILKNDLANVLNKKILKDYLERLKKSAILELSELHQVIKIFECFDKAIPLLRSWPYFEKFFKNQEDHKATHRLIIRPIRSLISIDGEINYKNHPELQKLNEQQIDLETKIRSILASLAQDSLFSDRLQFSGHDVINDRYVVAVRTDSYQAIMGPIISRSETGLTLYVEPYQVKELVTKRQIVLSQIAEILNQLCLQFSSLIHGEINLFLLYYSALIEIDSTLAKCDFSLKHH
jgi:DNA mismatch repair protein MutS2